MIKLFTMVSVGMVLLLTSGCGDGGAAVLKRRENLSQLGEAYRDHHATEGRAPATADELIAAMKSNAAADEQTTDAITSLEEGDVVMIWRGVLGDSQEEADSVLAFEARAPASGGYVLMADGRVRLMTGKEFVEATMLRQSLADTSAPPSEDAP